jgi:hypothetical protein
LFHSLPGHAAPVGGPGQRFVMSHDTPPAAGT